MKIFQHSLLRYLRTHPFSVMALANIVGDLCYLGFAFEANGFLSWPKLFGALFTIFAHIILLAYGDDQTLKAVSEKGKAARILLVLRDKAKGLIDCLPQHFQEKIAINPVAICFGMLAMNGFGLFVDAISSTWSDFNFSMMVQSVLGIMIVVGCGSFATADIVSEQKTANKLLKLAPSFLLGATVANGVLALTTLNPFMICAVLVFTLSNIAGFFTKLQKPATEC